MTDLDKALVALKENPEDPNTQMAFYGLFLSSVFYVPMRTEKINAATEGSEKEVDLPMIIDNEGSDFLVFFDQQKRLTDWADKSVRSAQMPGYVLTEITEPGVFWAMNVGTDHDKQFSPEEIAWLKGVIARSKGAAE